MRYDRRLHPDNVPLAQGIVGAAARTGRPVLVPDTRTDPRYGAMLEGICSEVAVPLVVRERVIGVLDLESEKAGFFTKDDAHTLSLLTPHLATAIENARLYERVLRLEKQLESDLASARHLLSSFLPRRAGIEIAAHNEAAVAVSGDFYQVFQLLGDDVGIFMAGVSGKGAAAAMYGALVSGLLRNLVDTTPSPPALLETANQKLAELKLDGRYVAAVHAQWCAETRKLTLANAGTPLPILCRGGKVELVQAAGFPLGLMAGAKYDEHTIEMRPGDVLAFASDGILEACDATGHEYGHDRFAALLGAGNSSTAKELVRRILEDLHQYSAGTGIHDDQTLVVLKVREPDKRT